MNKLSREAISVTLMAGAVFDKSTTGGNVSFYTRATLC